VLEFDEAIQESLAAFRCDGVDEACLAALPCRRALMDPTLLHEPAKQGVNKIIVQRGLPCQHAGLLLEGVSVLRAAEKHGEQH